MTANEDQEVAKFASYYMHDNMLASEVSFKLLLSTYWLQPCHSVNDAN